MTVSVEGIQPVMAMGIPRKSVLSDQQGDYVYVVGEDKKVELRRIQLGQSTPTTAVIASGLKEGELVIVEGIQRARPGIEVNPGPASPPPPPPASGPSSSAPAASKPAAGRLLPVDRPPRPQANSQMISGVFIDRPRLAIVIAILLTLAGALALTRIPVSQFPDIVPPQVTVATTFTGASAAVVEQTVAQPLEAAVVGVDKMIYMKSNSANDGSYTLTVSFELGTNPDIDAVNVNNRVQQAIARLPPEVQRIRPHGAQAFRRDPGIPSVLQRGRQAEPAVHQQLRHHQRAGPAGPRRPASARRCCSAGWTIRCASGSTSTG